MVVDSADRERIGLVKEELFRMLATEDVTGAVVLVYANKQDIAGAMSVAEISEALELTEIKTHQWHIQGCCAISGQELLVGTQEGDVLGFGLDPALLHGRAVRDVSAWAYAPVDREPRVVRTTSLIKEPE